MGNTVNKTEQKVLSPWIIKAVFAVMAIAIVGCYVYFKGNPLTGMSLNKKADRYLQENYPEIAGQFIRTTDAYFVKDKISVWDSEKQEYSVVNGTWNIYYSKNSLPDAYIYFVYDRSGNLVYDSCNERYLKGGMIYSRLSDEYNYYIENIFSEAYNNGLGQYAFNPDNLFENSYSSGWFENEMTTKQALGMWPASGHTEQYTGPVLDINKEYTMEELAAEYGVLLFNYKDEQTLENLYTRCMEVREIVKEYNIPFNKICITLNRDNGLYNISREELFSDNLMEFIENNYTVL
ncbi:MAG: hypothetical protein IJ410_08360 [Oscillospiraceae bacterium]|nr:hypothetical protein [Oscillospiraceae bacterium]